MSAIIEYKSDEILKGKVWVKQIENLKGHVFDTQWEIYALCISIGIMNDKQLDFENTGEEEHQLSIPRGILNRGTNQQLLDFMLQTSILTSRLVDFTEDERLEIAFSEKTDIDFDRRSFLTKFANYGISELDKALEGYEHDLEKLDVIRNYLDDAYKIGVCPPEEDEFLFDEEFLG